MTVYHNHNILFLLLDLAMKKKKIYDLLSAKS